MIGFVRGRGWSAAVVVVLAALIAAAAGWAYLSGAQAAKRASETRHGATPTQRETSRSRTVTVYFVKGEQFAPVTRQFPTNVYAPLGAIEALLAGPSDAERTRGIDTTIPPATRLASLEVESGTATLALNARQAVPTALDISLRPARAAQIVYTLTALPDIERVLIHVNGVKRATFIGADLVLGGAVDQRDISSPVQLPQRPANVPVGPAPVDVRGVQKRLQELSYLPRGAAIGAWDDRTNQAVLAFQGWHGLTRDGIVGPQTTAALESAAAPEPRSSGAGRRIEVHRDAGVVLLIDGATVVRAVHASTGGPGYETPAGSYSVFRKEMNSWSVPYQVWLPYASYFNGGIAFHASNEVPQRPVSHGCVRLPVPEAAFVYDFAAVGTSVVVY